MTSFVRAMTALPGWLLFGALRLSGVSGGVAGMIGCDDRGAFELCEGDSLGVAGTTCAVG